MPVSMFRIMAVAVVVELGKHVVPDLDVAVAVAAHGAGRLAAAVFFAPVIIDLGTRAAGACPMLPEIILLAEPEDLLLRNADLLIPDLVGLVVVQIDGRIEPVRIQPHHLGQKLPRPGNGLVLKIIAKGKIAQHLKKSAVTGRLADVLDIAGPDALLAGGNAPAGRNLLSGEIGFQGRHAGIDQQQAVIVMGHQREALHRQVALAFKKFQEHFPELVYAVLFQCLVLRLFCLFLSRGGFLRLFMIAVFMSADDACRGYSGQNDHFQQIAGDTAQYGSHILKPPSMFCFVQNPTIIPYRNIRNRNYQDGNMKKCGRAGEADGPFQLVL